MTDTDSFLERRVAELMADGPTIPLLFEELERELEGHVTPEVYNYAVSGAGVGDTMRANRRGFSQWEIVPRVLRDIAERDLSVNLFGESHEAPLMLAPIGSQSNYHPDGELASARAAADIGIGMALSTVSSNTIEDVAEALGDAPRVFQLYWTEDREVNSSLVKRAERAGYSAILVTVDSQIMRWRPKNLENAFSSGKTSERANFSTDPVAREHYEEITADDSAVSPMIPKDASLTWDDLSELREHTDLPILAKGVVHPDDARLAVEHGLDGVVVSNHGGRQVDGSIGAVDALEGVIDAVDGEITVCLDSGIRGGADAFKALALGADCVFVGRPYIYGLSIAGQQGVYEAALNVLAELESVMGLAGYTDIESVGPEALVEVDR